MPCTRLSIQSTEPAAGKLIAPGVPLQGQVWPLPSSCWQLLRVRLL